MLKIIYKVIILIAVFIAALSYFSRDIKEVVFDIDNTTTMEEATFPLVTIRTGESTINHLHGYSSNLDANLVRDSVIPLDMSKTFEVVIDQKDYDIKKLNYEIREFGDNSLIEADSVSVFTEDENSKTAKIMPQAEMTPEKEYAVKITLISSTSKKMYFYQRVKIYENSHLKEKLDFIMDFHKAIQDKTSAKSIINYLEPEQDADNSSLAYVNIHSSFDLISWGNLKPEILTQVIPTVLEIYQDTASVKLNYIASAEVAGAVERYYVTEFYRVRYSPDRMYLLNYDRYMESMFDVSLSSVTKSQLKLGITSETEVPCVADKSKVAFVRNRELWFYDLEKNEITKVFSFRQGDSLDDRDLYDQHDIRILSMDAEGNMDFIVYGYMNRGQYEGHVAIILYRFIRAEGRIEELVYIPVEEPYQTLKEHLSELAYVNSKEVFYFQVYDRIYSYNLITKELSVIASDIDDDRVVVFKDLNYAVWQENADISLSNGIHIMNLETGDTDTIPTKQGYRIRLMDKIDTNIIYGYVNQADITTMVDGRNLAPLSSLEIATIDKEVLKSYRKSGIYISDVNVEGNRIVLSRVEKQNSESGLTYYAPVSADTIMNQKKTDAPLVDVTARVTDQALTEYYMTLPSGFTMEAVPKVLTTVSTVISEETTVRLPETEQKRLMYYPYTVNGVDGEYEDVSEAVNIARDKAGVVLDSNRNIIWERGVKAVSYTISDISSMSLKTAPDSTIPECIRIMLAYQGINASTEQLSIKGSSAYEVLAKYSDKTPISLTGVTLDDVLYYVSKKRPILALTDIDKAVLIYGYDSYNIMVIDPSTGKKTKMGLQDSAKLFAETGNIFISYLE